METPSKWLTNGYIALFALLPWSVELDFGRWNMRLPSEPLIGALSIGLARLFWQNPQSLRGVFSKNIFLQISLAYIVCMAASACFSSLSIVSWKYWLIESTHWWVFAVGISAWPGLWRRALPWFVLSMAGVAVYTLAHHAFYHFRADQALLAPMPFFPDHTMWAAALAMVLFLVGSSGAVPKVVFLTGLTGLTGFTPFFAEKNPVDLVNPVKNQSTAFAFLLLFTALVFSTCRGAWVSVLLAGFLWAFFAFGKKGRLVLCLAFLCLGIFAGIKIAPLLSQDVSSLERLNRWNCSLRMAQEGPLFGFGPGTFQFQYLGFQKPEELTRISLQETSAEHSPHAYGRGGGAHSEYLRVLAEMGWLGLLLWLGLVMWALWVGFVPATLVAEAPREGSKKYLLAYRQLKQRAHLLLALLTFFLHGVVNDFLHDGRIAALVWGCMAMLYVQRQK